MSLEKTLKDAASQLGEEVVFKGLLNKTGVLKSPSVADANGVVGFNYLTHWEGACYKYYAANSPSVGMTQPVQTPCLLGAEIFDGYKIDYKEAIEIFHTGNWGSRFTSIVLSKPLIFPPLEAPNWYITSELGIRVVINANSGEVFASTSLATEEAAV